VSVLQESGGFTLSVSDCEEFVGGFGGVQHNCVISMTKVSNRISATA